MNIEGYNSESKNIIRHCSSHRMGIWPVTNCRNNPSRLSHCKLGLTWIDSYLKGSQLNKIVNKKNESGTLLSLSTECATHISLLTITQKITVVDSIFSACHSATFLVKLPHTVKLGLVCILRTDSCMQYAVSNANLDNRQNCQCAVTLKCHECNSFISHRCIHFPPALHHLIFQHKYNSTSVTILD